jgi:hypothetical protein
VFNICLCPCIARSKCTYVTHIPHFLISVTSSLMQSSRSFLFGMQSHYFELSTYWDDAPTWISFKEVVQFQRNIVEHAKKIYQFESISFVLPRVRKSPCSELPTNQSLVLKWLKLSMTPIVRSGLLHSESC